jgi:Bacterial mobilisation protein (MobC)
MARPKKITECLTRQLTFQMTPTDFAHLQTRLFGLPLAEYCRRSVLDAATVPTIDREAVRVLNEQLRRIGNNLNQVAHHANETGDAVDHDRLADVTDALKAALARVAAL